MSRCFGNNRHSMISCHFNSTLLKCSQYRGTIHTLRYGHSASRENSFVLHILPKRAIANLARWFRCWLENRHFDVFHNVHSVSFRVVNPVIFTAATVVSISNHVHLNSGSSHFVLALFHAAIILAMHPNFASKSQIM